MTSTENIKKDESDGEQEPEVEIEDGLNGCDYRALNVKRWQEQKNNSKEVRSGLSPSLLKEM
jgi:hypothetical protein